MANVEPGSWLCWVHSGIVWFVVVITQHSIKTAQARTEMNMNISLQYQSRVDDSICFTV